MDKGYISYATIDEQIQKLKAQNLIIHDEVFAREKLQLCGYSNLIKNYRSPYVITSDSGISYRSGVTFEQIYSLYLLDKNLRNSVMAAMQDFEEVLKAASAEEIAKAFGTHEDDYLQFNNYRNKKKRLYRFSLNGILEKIKNALETDKDPIRHYRTQHNIVPPWILFKSLYFSTIVNFINLFKIEQQNNLYCDLFKTSNNILAENSSRILLVDTLYLCLEYRNRAAHGERIYDYTPSCTVRHQDIFSDVSMNSHGFSQLLFLMSLLKYDGPYLRLKNTLNNELDRHCGLFPQDVTYLGQVLNIDIIHRRIVFVTGSSKKFHRIPHCSGIKNARVMEFDDAIANGYLPCKRCCD